MQPSCNHVVQSANQLSSIIEHVKKMEKYKPIFAIHKGFPSLLVELGSMRKQRTQLSNRDTREKFWRDCVEFQKQYNIEECKLRAEEDSLQDQASELIAEVDDFVEESEFDKIAQLGANNSALSLYTNREITKTFTSMIQLHGLQRTKQLFDKVTASEISDPDTQSTSEMLLLQILKVCQEEFSDPGTPLETCNASNILLFLQNIAQELRSLRGKIQDKIEKSPLVSKALPVKESEVNEPGDKTVRSSLVLNRHANTQSEPWSPITDAVDTDFDILQDLKDKIEVLEEDLESKNRSLNSLRMKFLKNQTFCIQDESSIMQLTSEFNQPEMRFGFPNFKSMRSLTLADEFVDTPFRPSQYFPIIYLKCLDDDLKRDSPMEVIALLSHHIPWLMTKYSGILSANFDERKSTIPLLMNYVKSVATLRIPAGLPRACFCMMVGGMIQRCTENNSELHKAIKDVMEQNDSGIPLVSSWTLIERLIFAWVISVIVVVDIKVGLSVESLSEASKWRSLVNTLKGRDFINFIKFLDNPTVQAYIKSQSRDGDDASVFVTYKNKDVYQGMIRHNNIELIWVKHERKVWCSWRGFDFKVNERLELLVRAKNAKRLPWFVVPKDQEPYFEEHYNGSIEAAMRELDDSSDVYIKQEDGEQADQESLYD
ncbi:hypothetical protein BELL_0546g00010 [Botrytis elliptica]|uniref:Uncharacterized protein n=1 Tax=Botrytis elliptica TaxID=278938 RepID=A0A4Z1JDM9_9HELO|nr:hypothetical protein BELL_0546g00010 [Botrytis elliptica]